MSRTARLFDLLTILRRHRHPVPGAVLARECGVSLRTLYRDIATLEAQGARIDGEAGVGYLLRPGFLLPPLMFSPSSCRPLWPRAAGRAASAGQSSHDCGLDHIRAYAVRRPRILVMRITTCRRNKPHVPLASGWGVYEDWDGHAYLWN